jgi:hypothetical protein
VADLEVDLLDAVDAGLEARELLGLAPRLLGGRGAERTRTRLLIADRVEGEGVDGRHARLSRPVLLHHLGRRGVGELVLGDAEEVGVDVGGDAGELEGREVELAWG